MNLEKRVQNLEQELQILKNQIQATLLTIQEQILTNAYPSIRANDVSSNSDEVHPPHSLTPAPRQEVTYGNTGNTDQAAPNTVRQVSLNSPKDLSQSTALPAVDYDDDQSDMEPPVAVVRKISLDKLDPMPPHRQQEFATSMPQQPRHPTNINNRKGQLPETEPYYESQDHFNTDEFAYDGRSLAPFIIETDWETLAGLEEWAASKIAAIGVVRARKLINRYAQQGRFTNQILSALLEFVSVYEDENDTGLPTPDATGLPGYFDAAGEEVMFDENDPYFNEDDTDNNPEVQRRTVLRLIAGIQNAGVGIKGKRRNG